CVSCQELQVSTDVVKCPCNHLYCKECLLSMFRASLKDTTIFPPRCCGEPVPIQTCRAFFPKTLVQDFEQRKLEFDTPNRVYCHRPTCSAFIPPGPVISMVARCPKCSAKTCINCKNKFHGPESCEDDRATKETLRLASTEGWQRCPSCKTVVALTHGCNHITCQCRAEFCYVCAAPWRTCNCPVWDEQRLIDQANARVDRNLEREGQGPLPEVERQALVQEQIRMLERGYHECEHRRWRGLKDAKRKFACEGCLGDTLHSYVHEYLDCDMLLCSRCWPRE
ncbi:hypothetical protein QBC34DRAFT_308728, partial [Podospora aff. communis PSN243]